MEGDAPNNERIVVHVYFHHMDLGWEHVSQKGGIHISLPIFAYAG